MSVYQSVGYIGLDTLASRNVFSSEIYSPLLLAKDSIFATHLSMSYK